MCFACDSLFVGTGVRTGLSLIKPNPGQIFPIFYLFIYFYASTNRMLARYTNSIIQKHLVKELQSEVSQAYNITLHQVLFHFRKLPPSVSPTLHCSSSHFIAALSNCSGNYWITEVEDEDEKYSHCCENALNLQAYTMAKQSMEDSLKLRFILQCIFTTIWLTCMRNVVIL